MLKRVVCPRLPHVIGNDTVLQRDMPVPLWVWAEAAIDGDKVVVHSDTLPQPVAVRYAWADNPVCNLYNEAGLPAAPFRTDDWPGITAKNDH